MSEIPLAEAERRYTRSLTPGEAVKVFPKEARELAPQHLALAEQALRAYYERFIAPAVRRARPEDRPIVELLVTARWPNWEVISELSRRIRHLRRIVATLREAKIKGRGLTSDAIERAKKYPLEDLCAQYGVELTRSGRTLKGHCPFHEDRKPSFVIYPGENRFYCFGCHLHGDAIEFLRRMGNLTFAEAVKELAR